MDIQSAEAVAIRLEGIRRRADLFGQDRDSVLREIEFLAEDFRKWAVKIEEEMVAQTA
jgi:hypothetical protein